MTLMPNAASLKIADLPTGQAYLARIPLSDPQVARQQLTRLLEGLLAAPPETGVLFPLLEQMRAPVGQVVDELARIFQNRLLPLADEAESSFQAAVHLLRGMADAYACCELPDTAPVNASDSLAFASILHRRIYYTGLIILAHFYAHREVSEGCWRQLNRLFALAELLGVAYTPVDDNVASSFLATHCAAAYTAMLLVDIAGPYRQTARDMNLIRRWAVQWAPLLSLHLLDDDLALPPYVVELAKDAPLHACSASDVLGDDARRLDTARLGLQIEHMLSQLRLRMTPAQLGLGDETAGHVLHLLAYLSRPWTQASLPRRFRRFASEGVAHVAQGFDAMYFHVEGREFEQADSASVYSRGDFDQLFTFRERTDPGSGLNIKPHEHFLIDQWSVLNHSASGFRLARGCAGKQVGSGQLVALCPHDGDRFLLGQLSWLMQDAAGDLVVGVSLLPGVPTGVGVRRSHGVMASSERFVPAFHLPAVPAIKEEASLVIPTGLYQASHVLDVSAADGIRQMRMNHVLQVGADFMRISYQPL